MPTSKNTIPASGQIPLDTLLRPSAADRYLAQPVTVRGEALEIFASRDFTTYWRMTVANSENCPYRVMPQFRPDWPGEGFWLEARDGEAPVFAICARLMPDPGEEAILRDLLRSWPGKWEIPETVNLEGRFLFNGGTWVATGYRGNELSPIACKLLHSVALKYFEFDYSFGVVVPEMWDSLGLSQQQGFRHHEPGIVWTGFYPQPQRMHLIYSDRREVKRSLRRP